MQFRVVIMGDTNGNAGQHIGTLCLCGPHSVIVKVCAIATLNRDWLPAEGAGGDKAFFRSPRSRDNDQFHDFRVVRALSRSPGMAVVCSQNSAPRERLAPQVRLEVRE